MTDRALDLLQGTLDLHPPHAADRTADWERLTAVIARVLKLA
jgi:hypothetical protein